MVCNFSAARNERAEALLRFSERLNCKRIVQVVCADDTYKQIKNRPPIRHPLSAGSFLRWLA